MKLATFISSILILEKSTVKIKQLKEIEMKLVVILNKKDLQIELIVCIL